MPLVSLILDAGAVMVASQGLDCQSWGEKRKKSLTWRGILSVLNIFHKDMIINLHQETKAANYILILIIHAQSTKTLFPLKEITGYYLDNLFYSTDLCASAYCSSRSTVHVIGLRSRKIVQLVPLQIEPSAVITESPLLICSRKFTTKGTRGTSCTSTVLVYLAVA